MGGGSSPLCLPPPSYRPSGLSQGVFTSSLPAHLLWLPCPSLSAVRSQTGLPPTPPPLLLLHSLWSFGHSAQSQEGLREGVWADR